ncbi:hypothetical protein H113_04386 [Trichophyton rubrum MR1459]|nr:hypothetical protein H100_04359 [Trichophyton rubrum MR850]EZF63315.1 hypothetical protein H104_04341 [Trichophyton rubrum CBS 289.86]EZF95334.1 hypothetical protein H113_04386 [Trichophyton rubrum MR1459]EZG16883.1 hypothetical protein H107_04470 [Trichophyton rubrum CBS 202.88]
MASGDHLVSRSESLRLVAYKMKPFRDVLQDLPFRFENNRKMIGHMRCPKKNTCKLMSTLHDAWSALQPPEMSNEIKFGYAGGPLNVRFHPGAPFGTIYFPF